MLLERTFHPDEANQAFTTGRLLETGACPYSPADYHGPTLHYAAAAIQKAAGHDSTAALDATLLRATPMAFAVLALVLGFLAVRRIARSASAALAFAVLLATAPMFVFFATDFIHEMPLACFTMMMLWAAAGYLSPQTGRPSAARGGRDGRGRFALLFGVAAGLAFATKETCALTFAAAAIAALPLLPRWLRARAAAAPAAGGFGAASHAALALAGFLLSSALLYSSFTADWSGVYSAFVAAPLEYARRAMGDAASAGAPAHVHPWWQYLKWLFGCTRDGAAHWSRRFSEIAVLAQALLLLIPTAGFCAVFRRRLWQSTSRSLRSWLLFSCAYTLALFALYSALPYKTPWCALQILLGLMLSLALGQALVAEILAGACPKTKGARLLAALLPVALAAAIALADHLPGLRRMAADPDSKEIPYNYASASPQVKAMAAAIGDALRGQDCAFPFVAVALPAEDTWPLPFYLRSVNGRVGYWTRFEELEALAGIGARPNVVVVPAEEGHLVQPLFPHLNRTRRFEMRPRVRIRVFWQDPSVRRP